MPLLRALRACCSTFERRLLTAAALALGALQLLVQSSPSLASWSQWAALAGAGLTCFTVAYLALCASVLLLGGPP